MTAVSIVLALLCSGCKDLPMTPDSEPPARLGSLLGCRVDVTANTSRCEILPAGGVSAGGASLELVHNAQWMIETGSGSFSAEDSTYRITVRVVNSTSQSMGTPDAAATTGIKAFLPYRPLGYHGRAAGDTLNDPYGILTPPLSSINQSVHARNPDGVQSFTAADQPYWEYAERIDPWETSGWREWEFTLHPDVSYFYFSVSILAAVPGEVQAGLSAPDGYLIPADSVAKLFAPANLVMRHPRMSGLYPRNVVQIAFKRSASRSERQAAIDLIGGRLIGGMGGYFYQVLIQDDGTAGPLWNAVDRVSKLPQVESGSPDVMTLNLGPYYRLPNDGAGWRRGDWSLSRDSSSGGNWAAEAISAPWAWGCETGNDSARVAVVDYGQLHSQWVHSVIARPSDDDLDIAGLMWQGTVSVTGATSTPALISDLQQAFTDSSHVINLSWGAMFRDTLAPADTLAPPLLVARAAQNTAHDDSLSARIGNGFAGYLRHLEHDYSWSPLYVVAAGNSQVDARLSGLPRLRSDPALGTRVLVVGASTNAFANPARTRRVFWANSGDAANPGSNFGGLVEISAPGADIEVFGADLVAADGTSFAAPHVAGVAGLLKSFDPRLSSANLKSLILEGAIAGARTSGTTDHPYPHLDAYEALKAAARRAGAPVCGNRLWVQNGELRVQRDTLSTDGEVLLSVPVADSRAVSFNALHGGKEIHMNSPSSANTGWRWTLAGGTSSWTSIPYQSLPTGTNASLHSRDGRSHARDSSVAILRTFTGPIEARAVRHTVQLRDGAGAVLDTFPSVLDSAYATQKVCQSTFVSVDSATHEAMMGSSDTAVINLYVGWRNAVQANPCTLESHHATRREVFSRVAYSPRFPEAYLVLFRRQGETVIESSFACRRLQPLTYTVSVSYNAICHTTRFIDVSAGSTVYRVNFASGTTTQVTWSEPSAELSFPTIGESGTEISLQRNSFRQEVPRGWSHTGDYPTAVSSPIITTETCHTQYRNLTTGATHLQPVTCWHDGGEGSFSPDRRTAGASVRE